MRVAGLPTPDVWSLVDKNQDRGHEFSSATSYYRKLVNDSSFNPFSYWNEMCRTGQLVCTKKTDTCCRGSAHQTKSAQNQLKTLNFSLNS